MLQPLGAHDVGLRQAQRLERLPQEAVADSLAPAVGGGAQDDDRHQVVHGHHDRPAVHAGHHVRVRVIEDVHQARPLGVALEPPRIEQVARHVALRIPQRAGQHQAGGIHVLRPPPRIAAGATPVLGLACERADLGGEPHLEPGIGALQPVVQPVGVAVHRGPALEGEVGDEEDAGHEEPSNGRGEKGEVRCGPYRAPSLEREPSRTSPLSPLPGGCFISVPLSKMPPFSPPPHRH